MKTGAILINTSRGPLIDEAALIHELQRGRIFAALDVYDHEPLAAGHPLLDAPNTVLTPHLGYGSTETFRTFYEQSVENALAFLDGKPIRLLVELVRRPQAGSYKFALNNRATRPMIPSRNSITQTTKTLP